MDLKKIEYKTIDALKNQTIIKAEYDEGNIRLTLEDGRKFYCSATGTNYLWWLLASDESDELCGDEEDDEIQS